MKTHGEVVELEFESCFRKIRLFPVILTLLKQDIASLSSSLSIWDSKWAVTFESIRLMMVRFPQSLLENRRPFGAGTLVFTPQPEFG